MCSSYTIDFRDLCVVVFVIIEHMPATIQLRPEEIVSAQTAKKLLGII